MTRANSRGRASARTCACCAGSWSAVAARRTRASDALGLVPEFGDLDWSASRFDARAFSTVMAHDRAQWERELAAHDELFAKLGDKRPAELVAERERLAARLAA